MIFLIQFLVSVLFIIVISDKSEYLRNRKYMRLFFVIFMTFLWIFIVYQIRKL